MPKTGGDTILEDPGGGEEAVVFEADIREMDDNMMYYIMTETSDKAGRRRG